MCDFVWCVLCFDVLFVLCLCACVAYVFVCLLVMYCVLSYGVCVYRLLLLFGCLCVFASVA